MENTAYSWLISPPLNSARPIEHIELYCAPTNLASPKIYRWQSTNVSLVVRGHPTSPKPR
jgi:hypothetical protein